MSNEKLRSGKDAVPGTRRKAVPIAITSGPTLEETLITFLGEALSRY